MNASATAFPLHPASRAEFACIREFFSKAGFEDRTVCQNLGMENMAALGRVNWAGLEPGKLPVALDWCLRVFARGLSTPAAVAREICGETALGALLKIGLLRPSIAGPDTLVCPVWLYPLGEFIVASDRVDDPDGRPFTPPADVVFPAIYGGTVRFLKLLPTKPEGEVLDVCGGSGIGAMWMAKTARASVTADLAERSHWFAEFNSQLNDLAVESLCGDLYAPVAGRQFDVITAHPPFVPATGPNMVYRDGGATGEEITRRVVEGFPAHLRPGGTGVILCVARDESEKTFEQRAMEWLGAVAGEFEVIFGLEKILGIAEVVESMRARGSNLSDVAARELYARLRDCGTRQFIYGALIVRRHFENRQLAPVRLNLTPDGAAADFEFLLAWRAFGRSKDFLAWLAQSQPSLNPALQLTIRHAVRDGELTPVECMFSVTAGFQAALRPDGWVVPLLARLTGQISVQAMFEASRQAGELPEGFALADFLDLVRLTIERQLLEVEFSRPARVV